MSRRRLAMWLRYVAHNSVVHPMMPFLPTAWTTPLHDVTARWAFDPTRPEAAEDAEPKRPSHAELVDWLAELYPAHEAHGLRCPDCGVRTGRPSAHAEGCRLAPLVTP